jgi:hypothetical protein
VDVVRLIIVRHKVFLGTLNANESSLAKAMITIQRFASVLGMCVFATALLPWSKQEVLAQSCNYFAGTAVGGRNINVDTCSISRASYQSVDFVYYLGNEKVTSQANCNNGTWMTFPERQVNRPQSRATQRMLNVVCNYRSSNSNNIPSSGKAFVFNPPSNIRTSPNGSILCSVTTPTMINIYNSVNSWYYTDVCGKMGVIHFSQIRF